MIASNAMALVKKLFITTLQRVIYAVGVDLTPNIISIQLILKLWY